MTAAIYYHPEAYTTSGPKLMGRNAAGESFSRLPLFGNKMKIEASVLLGDEDEEVEVHRKPNCGDHGRG